MDLERLANITPNLFMIAAIALLTHFAFRLFGKRNTTGFGGFWARATATLLDWLFFGAFIYPGIASVSYFLVTKSTGHLPIEHSIATAQIWADLAQVPGLWIYFSALESSKLQATLGKHAVGLKVIAINGERLTFLEAGSRNVWKIASAAIFLLGFVMVAWTKRKQALHDKVCGTLVVQLPRGRRGRAPLSPQE